MNDQPAQPASEPQAAQTPEQQEIARLNAEVQRLAMRAVVLEQAFTDERRRGDQIAVNAAETRVQADINMKRFQVEYQALSEDNLKLKAEIADLRQPAKQLREPEPKPAIHMAHPPAPALAALGSAAPPEDWPSRREPSRPEEDPPRG